MNAIVWYPKTIRNVTKTLWQVIKTPLILTENIFVERDEISNFCDFFRATCQVSHNFQPDFILQNLPFLVFNSSSEAEVYKSLVIVRPENEETLLFFLLLYYGGIQVAIFSADLDLFFLSQLIKDSIVEKKVFGTSDYIYRNFNSIVKVSEISAWLGMPNWDYRNNLIIFSQNYQNLRKISQVADSYLEPIYSNYSDAFKKSDITYPRFYISDALIEMERYL